MAATVLVTGMGSNTAISVAKALRRQDEVPVRIVGTDIHPAPEVAGRAFCDTLRRVPRASDPAYAPALLELCRSERVQALFPIVDPEVEALARAAPEFARLGVAVWASPAEVVRACNDKRLTSAALRRHGVAVPRSWTPQEAQADPAALPYPLIVKPARGVSSQHVVRVASPATLADALAAVPEPVVEELVEGPEYTVDYLSDAHGTPLAAVPRQRLETKAGISVKGVTEEAPAVAAAATKAAQALGIRGPCNLQCRVRAGVPVFFDVNPRFSGALPLTVAAGVNGPLILTKLALGLPVRPEELRWQPGVVMARYWEEVFWRPGDPLA